MSTNDGAPQAKSQALTIVLKPGGAVTVTGPLADKILCYGLLKMAEQIVEDYVQPAQNGIIPVPPGTRIDA
jgi:hypothetical protein